MDSLIRQMRMKYADGEDGKERSNTSINRDRAIPLQNSQSFKGEKKKTQGWFKRSSTHDDSSKEVEYASAIAAAALAIDSLGNSSLTGKKALVESPNTSMGKGKSKTENRSAVHESAQVARRLSAELGGLEVPDRIVAINDATQKRMLEEATTPVPSIRKTATAAEKKVKETTGSKQDAAAKIELSRPAKPSSIQPAGTKRQSSKIGETKAEIWERIQMDKIKHRYEKLTGTITSWEEDRKKKARRNKDSTDANLDQRRAKAMQHYNNTIARIYQIAEAARAKAKEKQEHEESKVKEKANRIRTTGKEPTVWLCF